MLLSNFLEDKPLYYAEIDYERMPRIYEKIKHVFLSSKIIHLVGTNGKGTTGRFLAGALHNLGFKVGHYTSPHILSFNERIWMNGKDISDETLETMHLKLKSLLDEEDIKSLSYFEYTTFLAMLSFNGCEYIILEAGLGGKHDATAVFPKALTLVTPISYDHEAFLGSTIKSIANEKLSAVQNYAILAKQEYADVYKIASELEEHKNINIRRLETINMTKDKKKIEYITDSLSLPKYLKDNLTLAIAALDFFNIEYTENDFQNTILFGRLSKLNENIFIDVGHNPLAAQSILESLRGEKYILVYNSYKDKKYKKILEILKPIIMHVEIITIEDIRIEEPSELYRALIDLKIEYLSYKNVQKDKKYLVFGSFKVVEEFLKVYNE